MPLPRSLVQPFRRNTIMVGAGWRAYYAPFNIAASVASSNTTVGPTILDLTTGPFDVGRVLPSGFFDCGWIKDFKLTPETKIGQVRSGYRGAVRAQYRGQVGESFEFKFREYCRMQYKLATGGNVFNLLAGAQATTTGPLSASGAVATVITGYAPATGIITVGSTAALVAAGLQIGSYIVCDIDYNPSTYGIVGDAGTPVFQNAVTDVDYIRKNSDYVGRVTAVSATQINLDQPFVGGGSSTTGNNNDFPVAGAKVQLIKGWAGREGGTFISEWTALFLLDTVDAAQIAVYYPHVSIAQPRDVGAAWAIENAGTTDETGYELDAQFAALAFDDPLDGETCVGYKCFFPRPGQAAAI